MLNEKTRLLFLWLSREKKTVYNIYALAFLQGALYVTIPLTIQGIITYTMAGRFSASLVMLSVLTVVITLFIGLLQLWQMRINEALQERILCRLTERLTQIERQAAETKRKIKHFFEVVTLQKGIGKILLEFSFSVISIVFGLLLLPAYSNWFVIFSVVLGIVFYLVVSYYGKKAQESNLQTSTQKYRIYEGLADSGTTVEEIDRELEQYLYHRKAYYTTFEQQYKGILFFKVFFVSVLLFLGTYLVQIGELNIGQFVASEIIILLVINAVEKLVGSLGTCYDIVTALYKIESLFGKQGQDSFLRGEQQPVLSASTAAYSPPYKKATKRFFYALLITGFIVLFLPWTQSVHMDGTVTALDPGNKPQQITSRIAGRIEKWYIRDGDFVKRNDTIAFISEIKEDYLDPLLVQRSEAQVRAKETSLQSYESKVDAIHAQIDAINKTLRLKSEQARNKIMQVKARLSSDSVELTALTNAHQVAGEQFRRYEELLSKGVISQTDFENRKVKLQEAYSKKIAAENKLRVGRNELLNAELELNSLLQEYNEKLTKAESDKFSTISLMYEAEGMLTKLQNQVSNYSLRSHYYYVLAPQDGFISGISVNGVGEIVKEGGMLCRIVPPQKEQAVELFVDPIDLPLISRSQEVRLVFDGWPAFVFSGWPGLSTGSFRGEVVTFDKVISPNGKFRVLVANRKDKWPEAIQIGGGVRGFALLQNVPLVYELWRKANGFPPEFYQHDKKVEDDNKK